MTPRVLARATLCLAIGYAVAAMLYWAVLNVPESNVPMLLLSAGLAVAIVGVAGIASGGAAALGDDAPFIEAGRQGRLALGAFLIGWVLVALIWRVAGTCESWWGLHRGEIDAVFLRYLAVTRTRWLHETVSWGFWVVRWVVGLSILAALTAAGTLHGARGLVRGLRIGLGVRSLGAVAVLVAMLSLLQRYVLYWRPRRLPPHAAELAFVGIKLTVLYLVAALGLATVLALERRFARRSLSS